jgi:hypothetical protein
MAYDLSRSDGYEGDASMSAFPQRIHQIRFRLRRKRGLMHIPDGPMIRGGFGANLDAEGLTEVRHFLTVR